MEGDSSYTKLLDVCDEKLAEAGLPNCNMAAKEIIRCKGSAYVGYHRRQSQFLGIFQLVLATICGIFIAFVAFMPGEQAITDVQVIDEESETVVYAKLRGLGFYFFTCIIVSTCCNYIEYILLNILVSLSQ